LRDFHSAGSILRRSPGRQKGKIQPHPPRKIAQTEANSSQSDRIVSDGIEFEFGRGGWRFDPLSIDFQFNLSGRAQLPPTQRNLGIVPGRNDVRP